MVKAASQRIWDTAVNFGSRNYDAYVTRKQPTQHSLQGVIYNLK